MKAKVKATGEIVEVEKALDAMWRDVEKNGIFEKLYYTKDLDFNLDNQYPEATISGWVARDKDGELMLFPACPLRDNECWYGDDWWTGDYKDLGHIILDDCLFPEITWQDDPIEVEITIKPKMK